MWHRTAKYNVFLPTFGYQRKERERAKKIPSQFSLPTVWIQIFEYMNMPYMASPNRQLSCRSPLTLYKIWSKRLSAAQPMKLSSKKVVQCVQMRATTFTEPPAFILCTGGEPKYVWWLGFTGTDVIVCHMTHKEVFFLVMLTAKQDFVLLQGHPLYNLKSWQCWIKTNCKFVYLPTSDVFQNYMNFNLCNNRTTAKCIISLS